MDGCLTLDIGNTNASLAFVSFVDGAGSRPGASALTVDLLGAWRRDDDEADRLEAALRGADSSREWMAPRRTVGVSAVGSHERESRLADQLVRLGWEVAIRPDAGLRMEIDHPETCGSDRQYAMRAALEDGWRLRMAAGGTERYTDPVDGPLRVLRPLRVLVVDAGTALTVDAGMLRSGAGVDGGVELAFLGGAIAMGPGSLAEAITARGARLAPFEVDPEAPALGRSTVEALRAGASVGFRGAVRELCRSVSQEAFGGTQDVFVYLTGGARSFARAAVAETFPVGFHESAHLVHAGLARTIRSGGAA